MFRKQRAPKWALILVLVLVLATTALAAAQAPDVYIPLVTGGVEPVQDAPETLVEEEEQPLFPDPETQVQEPEPPPDSAAQDAITDTGPDEASIAAAFNATQWTVQNKLGIGTTTPAADIDLARNVNQAATIQLGNSSTGTAALSHLYIHVGNSKGVTLQQFGAGYTATKWGPMPLTNMARLRTNSPVTGLILTTGGAAPLIMGTADTERMRITPDGRVGIGIPGPDPDYRLTVTGRNGLHGIKVTSPEIYGVHIERPQYDGVYVNDAGRSALRVVGGGGVYLDNVDNFGVNILHPGNYGMLVNCPCAKEDSSQFPGSGIVVYAGDIRVIDGSFIDSGTTLNVPDYVFEPKYPLMPLNELRAYVAEEKHLPNVPDEEQIRAGGLDLSDFQMKLLEKTEELTLYTLAQDEQLQAQQQEIESLQRENQVMQQMMADMAERLAALEEQE